MMKHIILFVLIMMAPACFASNSNLSSSIAQASTATSTQVDINELNDVVDAANLLIYFKAYLNSDEMKESSEFGDFLYGYEGPKEYAFEETRSAETVWYRNCTLKRNSPFPQTYAKGTTSIVSLEMKMGGGMTVYLCVFNEKAANQIKRQLQRLNIKVSDNYNDDADAYIVYDQPNKCWVMSCNQFSDFITRDQENPQPYLTAKLLPSLIDYIYVKSHEINYFEGLGFKKMRFAEEDYLMAVYCHQTKFNNMDDYDNFDKWFTANDKSAIGIIDSFDGGYSSTFIFYNKQLYDEMKAKAVEIGYKLYPESNPGSEMYEKGDNYIVFSQKSGCYQVCIFFDNETEE